MDINRKNHWETVYQTKNKDEVSWTQKKPIISLEFISDLKIDKSAEIIDIGGGDSNLVDYLIDEGYQNITVLDISEKALEKSKIRLGEKAKAVTWIVSDILDFKPKKKYDLWHDRAAFHFLTNKTEIEHYVNTVLEFVNGSLIMGTFSDEGPLKCSGLEISQYSEPKLSKLFNDNFKKIKCVKSDHTTPFNTTQNFLFCSFVKID
ncbi:class I SAM-dependent methyltransferase [Candidatus Kapabacteria bacterium]|nr:class I SAM-dependent methyltransferase [Candidatus Kapabacteria bacterium]